MLPRAVFLALCLALMPVWSQGTSWGTQQSYDPPVPEGNFGSFQQSYDPPVPEGNFGSFQPSYGPPAPEGTSGGILQSYGPPTTQNTFILQPELPTAEVDIIPGTDSRVNGKLYLYRRTHGVYIKGYIRGLSPGLHGFHVHQVASLGNQCKDAGSHFNPFMRSHGAQLSPNRHVGDLGNILAILPGVAYINLYDFVISLDPKSEAYIGDRSFVVHERPDDLGLGGDEESLKTGNAGARLGCGLVRVTSRSYAPLG